MQKKVLTLSPGAYMPGDGEFNLYNGLKPFIEKAITKSKSNDEAAEKLGITVRTLYRLKREFSINLNPDNNLTVITDFLEEHKLPYNLVDDTILFEEFTIKYVGRGAGTSYKRYYIMSHPHIYYSARKKPVCDVKQEILNYLNMKNS